MHYGTAVAEYFTGLIQLSATPSTCHPKLFTPRPMSLQVAAAREAIGDSDFFLIARTDARATSSKRGLDEAINRANIYLVCRLLHLCISSALPLHHLPISLASCFAFATPFALTITLCRLCPTSRNIQNYVSSMSTAVAAGLCCDTVQPLELQD